MQSQKPGAPSSRGLSTIFLPNNPAAANDFMMQILAGLRAGMGNTRNTAPIPPPV